MIKILNKDIEMNVSKFLTGLWLFLIGLDALLDSVSFDPKIIAVIGLIAGAMLMIESVTGKLLAIPKRSR